jgi:uncharacterized protein
MPTLVDVISDTHGLLRPEALEALKGVAMIIHAGDVGKREVFEKLQTFAAVFAIRGNIDTSPWADELPATRAVEIEQARIYVLHSLADLDFDPASQGYGAVISGHSHKPKCELRRGVLYLNPGSAGPRRFRLPVTVARLLVNGKRLEPEIITLMAS